MSRPIRLLLVTKSTGGVATYIRSIVKRINRDRFSVSVICLSEEGKEFADELMRTYGVRAFNMAMNRYKVNPITDTWVLFQLAQHIRREKYDVIHVHASKPGFLMRIAAIGTGIPVIYSPHNFAFHEGSHRLAAWLVAILERFAIRYTARIIAVAEHERRLALQYGVGTSSIFSVVHSGIDSRPFRGEFDILGLKSSLGIPANAVVVGAVGRLAIPKLPLDFVKSAVKLHALQPDIHFVWVGSGPLASEAIKMASSLGLAEVFHWLGERSDVSRLLHIFNCLILPSRWEAFPLVVLEAFASGVPVIATDNLGTHEIIESGRNGWLVPIGDIEALSRAILHILANPHLVESICQTAAKQIDEEYTLEKMISTLEHIYAEEARELINAEYVSMVNENH